MSSITSSGANPLPRLPEGDDDGFPEADRIVLWPALHGAASTAQRSTHSPRSLLGLNPSSEN
jgi:hypothetical protein